MKRNIVAALAMWFSLVRTARENCADEHAYLQYTLEEGATLGDEWYRLPHGRPGRRGDRPKRVRALPLDERVPMREEATGLGLRDIPPPTSDDWEVTPIGVAILYDGSDGHAYYWTGDPESVPYHVSGEEKAAFEKVFGLKLQKLVVYVRGVDKAEPRHDSGPVCPRGRWGHSRVRRLSP